MKSITCYKHVLLVLSLLLTGSLLMAQVVEVEKKKKKDLDEVEATMEIQKAIQAAEMKNRKDMLEDQQQELREMERYNSEQARHLERTARESSRARASSRARVSSRSSSVDDEGHYLIESYSQDNHSQITLRKTFREATSTSKGEFEVDSNIRKFRCMISGSVRSGEILVGIEYPDGKIFKELVINPSADINFSQSISIKEGEDKKYVGNWKYVIKADKADGNYMVQIMTH